MSDVSTPVSLKLAWNADDPLFLARDLLPDRVFPTQLTPKGIHMKHSLIKTIIISMAIFSLAGCGETYDADNPTKSVSALKAELENQAAVAEFDELWGIYQRGYVNDQAEATGPDYSRFDGMNAEEMHKELREYVDWIDVSGMFIAPPGYIESVETMGEDAALAQARAEAQGQPSVDIEVRGNTVYLTATEDTADINDIVINRGNCRIQSNKLGKRISRDEYAHRKEADPSYFAIQIGQMGLYAPGIYEYVKPFPVKMKFGQKFKWSTYRRCNIVEVTVTDANGQWTWEFQ